MLRIVVALVLVVGLAGCGGGEERADRSEVTQPPASDSPSAISTPNGTIGPTEFARLYVDEINKLQSTGDTEPISRMETANCRSCVNVREAIAQIYAAGGHVEGGSWRVEQLLTNKRLDDNTRLLALSISHGPQTVWEHPNERPSRVESGTLIATFILSHGADGWRVNQWSKSA